MKVLISQSNYIPWRGFIDLVRQADVYIVYDSMQFTKNDWRNRNLIRNNGEAKWLSVPCGSSISRSIDQVFPTSMNWYKKHSATIKHSYSKSLYWPEFGNKIMNEYENLDGLSLTDVNIKLLSFVLNIQNIDTRVVKDVNILPRNKLLKLERTMRLIQLCRELGATTYITAPAAKNYLLDGLFIREGISVSFYEYPKYKPVSDLGRELSWIDPLLLHGSLF